MNDWTKSAMKKACEKAGLNATVRGRGRDFEVELPNDNQMRRFRRDVAQFGGFKTGWGAWVVRPHYRARNPWTD